MIGPGQDLEEVIQNMHVDALKRVVGEDIVETLRYVSSEKDLPKNLRLLACDLLLNQPERYFSDSDVRSLLYQNMSRASLEGLAERLEFSDANELKSSDPSKNAAVFSKFLGYFGIDLRSSAISTVEPDQESISPQFGLFRHQRRAADGVWRAIGDGLGRVVLHMPTGAGKTRTAMHIVSRYLTTHEPAGVVWLASSSELLEQASEAFKEAWSVLGNRDVDLLRMWGRYQPSLEGFNDGLLVASLQKVHSWASKNPLEVFRFAPNIKLVVVDEAHQAIAPTYRGVIEQLSEAGSFDAVLGLTATPGRTWADISADEELAAFFEDRKVMLEVEGYTDPVSYLVDEGYLAKPTFRTIRYQNPGDTQKSGSKKSEADYNEEVLERLSQDAERNSVIIEQFQKLIEEGHSRILFFASSVRHAETISSILLVLGIDARVVTGETSQLNRSRIIKAFRSSSPKPMVICNYGVLTTGFDAPQTSAAVIARPTKSLVLFSQMVGRATRGPKAGGNKECTICTVVDTALPGFGDVAEAFTNWEDVWNG